MLSVPSVGSWHCGITTGVLALCNTQCAHSQALVMSHPGEMCFQLCRMLLFYFSKTEPDVRIYSYTFSVIALLKSYWYISKRLRDVFSLIFLGSIIFIVIVKLGLNPGLCTQQKRSLTLLYVPLVPLPTELWLWNSHLWHVNIRGLWTRSRQIVRVWVWLFQPVCNSEIRSWKTVFKKNDSTYPNMF